MTSSLRDGSAPAWPAARVLAVVVSSAGMAGACVHIGLVWAGGDQSLLARVDGTIRNVSDFALLGLALLIAWRAGRTAANVSMALAIAFVFGVGGVFIELLTHFVEPSTSPLMHHSLKLLLFYLGAAFYIRAAQLFPRAVTPFHVINSPTMWGRISVLRNFLVLLLRPA